MWMMLSSVQNRSKVTLCLGLSLSDVVMLLGTVDVVFGSVDLLSLILLDLRQANYG